MARLLGKALIESRTQVDEESGCWLWQGRIDKYGYARIGDGHIGHRYAYKAFVGPIPEGLDVDHVCHMAASACAPGASCPHRRCVNPQHLEPVTRAENNRRRWVAAKKSGIWSNGHAGRRDGQKKSACIHGHEFTPANTRMRSDGGRACRTCVNQHKRERRARARAARS